MGIFRQFKTVASSPYDNVSCHSVSVPETLKKKNEDGSYTNYRVIREKDITEYSQSLDSPTSEEYSLELMLKNGDVPQEIPVSGVLNPTDSSDPRVQSELSDMAEQLHSVDENFNINN